MPDLIRIEVIAPVLTDFRHCAHCETIFDATPVGDAVHQQILNDYPEEWKEDFERLSTWLTELAHTYGPTLQIKLVDPQSVEGFFKSIRYGVRRYPAFIIEGREKYIGWDKTVLGQLLHIYAVTESTAG